MSKSIDALAELGGQIRDRYIGAAMDMETEHNLADAVDFVMGKLMDSPLWEKVGYTADMTAQKTKFTQGILEGYFK